MTQTVLRCCRFGCTNLATHEIREMLPPTQEYSHACAEHIGDLITDAIVHEVVRLEAPGDGWFPLVRALADASPAGESGAVQALAAAQATIDRYKNCFAEITAKATPYGSGPSDDPEKIRCYIIPAGPLHRAAGQIEGQWFDGLKQLEQAQATIKRLQSDAALLAALPPAEKE